MNTRMNAIRQKLKPWMLPIAMLLGALLHNYIGMVAFLSKYLIFIMLLITYCRLNIREFKVGSYIWWLLAVQIPGALAAWLLLLPVNPIAAQGAFICIFCPTATAAPVITGMLGGKVSRVATYSLFSNVFVAFLAPALLTWIATDAPASGAEHSFLTSMWTISYTVLPLILGPLAVALLLERFTPSTHRAIAQHQGLSFYIWAFSLIIVVGNSVSFILKEPASCVPEILILCAVSLIVCALQFGIGRIIGKRHGDAISGAQSLGQKNTVLAIWLALTYMNPLISVAPAAYVAWHNTINSIQIYLHERSRLAPENRPDNAKRT